MNLKVFLSTLLVYRSNFQVLHWMSHGNKFFRLHTLADEYVSEINKDIDIVAEMHLRREDNIVNYENALKMIEHYEDHEFLLIEDNKLFDKDEFVKYSRRMFKDILYCIEELLDTEEIKDPKNVGIKATLEGLHDKYDLKCNYLLKRYAD